jgi:hypothetical protein
MGLPPRKNRRRLRGNPFRGPVRRAVGVGGPLLRQTDLRVLTGRTSHRRSTRQAAQPRVVVKILNFLGNYRPNAAESFDLHVSTTSRVGRWTFVVVSVAVSDNAG